MIKLLLTPFITVVIVKFMFGDRNLEVDKLTTNEKISKFIVILLLWFVVGLFVYGVLSLVIKK